jgi:hypothetical protein
MMLEMLPRLWEYQIELPARTVIHATAAIAIGVILITKIVILRFFRHFEEAMPLLGFGLLLCTVVLATLSLPFALRAHGGGAVFADENRVRVRTILSHLELSADGQPRSAEELSSRAALERGRDVVMHRCASCHDLRTVLLQPRTGAAWLALNRRMQNKPTLDVPLSDDEVLHATAYLIAITPRLREDVRARREEVLAREEAEDVLGVPTIDDTPPEPEPPPEATAPTTHAASDAATEALDAGVEDMDTGVAARPDAGRRPRTRRDAGSPRDAGAGPSVLPPTSQPTTEIRPDAAPRATPDPGPVRISRDVITRFAAM